MFFVVVTRMWKINTGKTGQYEPRLTNTTAEFICGPFDNRKAAQRSLVSAMRSHTCLSAKLVDEDGLRHMAAIEQGYSLRRECDRLGVAKRVA